ncbi:MAG: FAD-dependent oxidoreductase [Arenicella sp.]|nr:FAD-dependent oxidoreductase [Arenicella sp.]
MGFLNKVTERRDSWSEHAMKNTVKKRIENVVIIGASHAAAEAISTLRKSGWEGSIALVGDEKNLPYQRPPLSKAYYKGELGVEKLAIKNPQFYLKAKVDLFIGRRVESINRQEKYVTLDDGKNIDYSHLIIATGTRARYLSVEGGDLHSIKYLRTMADVDDIKKALKSSAKLLIVGAGYIGLEVAASATKQGLNVTVLEAMDRVLARVTSPVVSSFYQNMHAQAGVEIRLNTALEKFAEIDGKYFAVLANGEKLEFDCAIVGIGVIPNTELADDAGLLCDNGIVVDEFTRTADPFIYAVGDCSNHPNFIYHRRIRLESVPNAVAQAKTAAKAICGKDVVYKQLPWFWSDQYDVKLQTAGLLAGYDDYKVEGDVKGAKFSVRYFKHGKLIALDALNSPAEFIKAKKLIMLEASE